MMMSDEVKTLKVAEDKPKDCKFCYYWCGKKKGCIIGGVLMLLLIRTEKRECGHKFRLN